ncbi:acyl-CoA dehydrogenase family protein [Curvibacter sp. HBC28]|uniref:Acyl-CoA dehydrogenase family protein n=1 Tax=Curvibacter microcysteis TaxID=3026419 RepID=A0ABT5MFA2_9BURK|nr:acyl-CoA dehydrogenase family protein [Curvibacter sp. HBC28]MDD0815257.1 acyl-CoA dehydrogenase family protein [Curvibacter sp. HBC28]
MSETLLADAPAQVLPSVAPPAAPGRSLSELKRRVTLLLPAVREGAEARERDRVLPQAQVRSLVAAGLLTLRIPVRDGGPGGSVRDLIELVIDIAAADSNVAQALRPGFLFVEGLLAGPDEAARQLWWPRCLRGDFIANAGWEIGGPSGAVTTQLRREGDHFRVTGSKYYSTGGLYADWISTVAVDEQGQPVRFVLPRDRAGLELLDDFDAMGQRLTASGTTHLSDVLVHEADIVPNPTGGLAEGVRTVVTPLAQLFLGAVLAGIARNELRDAVAFAQQHARPIKHSSASRSVDDPYVELSVGEISARALGAEAVVLRAAERIDAAWGADLDQDAIVHASIDVAQAQYLASESALKAAELLFEVGGASTTWRRHNLDRHWRNARTVSNHNPRLWKAAVVGAWHLKDVPPPASGLF